MWQFWMKLILAWISLATPIFGQSGDGDWGSGFDILPASTATNDTLEAVGDEPASAKNNHLLIPSSPSPSLQSEPQPDKCSVHFSTKAETVSARKLKARREELDYLRTIQRANKAVVENLAQFVGAELGDQKYEDVIKENIISIQEDHKGCSEDLEKAEEDLRKQLEGDGFAGMEKVREESVIFEEMLRAAADIASRLERSSQALHVSFTRQLKDIVRN
ncbi:uncharacterized protein LOC106943576 [Poecilia latipinna]|uniref:uncharacterized protein LOC103132452 n=1 Tax=Poecilia formosa TaxID=48698 RepID=UPI000443DEDE|nr:PREDICTED: uncharacterized protein LOC103132452 [Poecilia formosa]XP_007552974.1 PREDICTED: uncharacterized protein LOC103138637 [Poecilia formosa]XP_014882322.1 PREDICTED: uncharacterized protein LOC106943526 [Poecilia latipinna]XP_014882367.1 PREDICTED: uncharacterized protein LOC106943576 [Poecilia latipinna]